MNETRTSETFRVVLTAEAPTDPRGGLGALIAVTERFRQQNARMDLGLRIGFRQLEERHGVNIRSTSGQ
jgi:hypothetical protein